MALVWTLENIDGIIPGAQISMDHGLVVAADAPFTDQISTGVALWEYRLVDGVTFCESGLGGAGSLSGSTVRIDGLAFPWGIERGDGNNWERTETGAAARKRISNDNWGVLDGPLLKAGALPPSYRAMVEGGVVRYVGRSQENGNMVVDRTYQLFDDEAVIGRAWADAQPFQIEPRRNLWILVDLEEYYCGFPELTMSGGRGAKVDVLWSEALCLSAERPFIKGNRNELEGKTFLGRGDQFSAPGGDEPRCFSSFWWSCGRFVAIRVQTGEEDLTLYPLRIRESRYPFEFKAKLRLENEDFERSRAIMWRSVQMCAHETYMDCPYYEQMNYAADTRIQVLITLIVSGDMRLARQCIELFASSLMPTGLTSARYPADRVQIIPQFSLYWIAMLYDYGLWKGEPQWLKSLLPHARFILDTFLGHVDGEGILRCPDGWNWVDWAWNKVGIEIPDRDFTAVNQLLLINVLGHAIELERWLGRKDVACHYDEMRTLLWDKVVERYWCETRGLFSSSVEHDDFGEHEQCFAVLSGLLDESKTDLLRQSLVESCDIEPATLYFQHYLFSAYAKLGLQDRILAAFRSWGEMADMGLRTTLERSGENRSDCHAWSAHPLYHAAVSIAGIRPGSFGFADVVIAPALNTLASAEVSVPHEKGFISVSWIHQDGYADVRVKLPEGLGGRLELAGETYLLEPGVASNHRVASTFMLSEKEEIPAE